MEAESPRGPLDSETPSTCRSREKWVVVHWNLRTGTEGVKLYSGTPVERKGLHFVTGQDGVGCVHTCVCTCVHIYVYVRVRIHTCVYVYGSGRIGRGPLPEGTPTGRR